MDTQLVPLKQVLLTVPLAVVLMAGLGGFISYADKSDPREPVPQPNDGYIYKTVQHC